MPKIQGGGKYLKLYYAGVESLSALPANAGKVFLNLAKPMAPNNIVRLDKDDRKKVSEAVGVSERKVMELLTLLVREHAIMRLGKGKYFINPRIATKRREIEAVPLIKKWDRLLTEDALSNE